MADWKQITARIRRARTSKDPAAQLSNLFEKTHDAMAAFELARYFETTGNASDAGKWYATAAGRFRRADWKTKAQDAAVRLGASLSNGSPMQGDDFLLTPPVNQVQAAESASPTAEIPDAVSAVEVEEVKKQSADAAGVVADSRADGKRPRRRGRRGGRNRRKTGASAVAATTERPVTKISAASPSPQRTPTRVIADEEQSAAPAIISRSVPSLQPDGVAEAAVPGLRGRYGDPGLSSRLMQLEMQFRRLLTCAPSRLNDADQAPVGPGVFVLTDSDLTTYYYVEACQTLRIAIGNLIRSGTSRRGAESLKPQLAEHLGIPEARVTKYLADHCVVRWLQLDEGASHFAHFVVSVLRPKLNE